ncbi:MAG: tetratricopeptide repeat protein, partial [Candidatus Margulisiibacteriota bacterium]
EGWVEASRVKEPTEDLYLLGYRAFENKNYSEAINNFKQVLQYDPQNPRTHLFLARIYAKQNKIDLAADEVKAVLSQEPENQTAKYLAGVLANKYLILKDYARVFELKPQLVVAKLNENAKEKMVVEAKVVKKSGTKVAAASPAVSKEILTDSIGLVKSAKTSKGSSISLAINSVLSLTKSLGTKIHEDGWRVVAASDGLRVIYACRQERGGKLENENFEWKVNQDTRSAEPINENARVLMNRW